MEKVSFNKLFNHNKSQETVDVNAVSRISEGTSVSGELTSCNDIRVDGAVSGKMYSDGRIVVGENAVIEGTILCSDLDLWGRVEGEIYVKNLLSLKSTASVAGGVHVRKLQVEMGAAINGSCKMISEADFDACLGKAREETAAEAVSEAPEVEDSI